MQTRQQDFLLGLVTLAFLALAVGTILFVSPRLGVETRDVVIRFRHNEGVAPLKPGSPVMLSGALQVGKVREVATRFSEPDAGAGRAAELLIIVTARVDKQLPLFKDCMITTDQPPVGGAGLITILDVGVSGDLLAPGEPVDGLPPQSLASAIGALSRRLLGRDGMLDQVERTLNPNSEGSLVHGLLKSVEDINVMTAELRAQLSPAEQRTLLAKALAIMDNVRDTTQALRQQMQASDAGSIVAKVQLALDRLNMGASEAAELLKENRPSIRGTLAHIENVSRAIDEELLARLARELDPDDPATVLGKVHTALDQLNASLDDVAEVTETGRSVVLLSRPSIERIVQNLVDASEQAQTGLQQLFLQPWRFFKPSDGELKRLDVFEAARSFAAAASHLDGTTARLQALLEVGAAGHPAAVDRRELESIREALRGSFDKFRDAESYLWERMK